MPDKQPIDIEKVLIGLGIDEKKAKLVSGNMNGVDYLNLVTLIDSDDTMSIRKASDILRKYGIKLEKEATMESKRLETIFQEMHKNGKAFEAADIPQYVRPISEVDSPGAKMSGYSNFVRTTSDAEAEALRDWLEENGFDFQNNDKHTFLVQCDDREQVYRLNHFISNRRDKSPMFDSADNKETLVANIAKSGFKGKFGDKISFRGTEVDVFGAKQNGHGWELVCTDVDGNTVNVPVSTANMKLKRNIEEKKSQMRDTPAKRNPMAQLGRMKSGAGAHASATDKEAKRDAWSRRAKHKKKFMADESFVEENDVEIVVEGVLGMTKVDPLYRLKELAGVKAAASSKLTEEPIEDEIEIVDDFDDAELSADILDDASVEAFDDDTSFDAISDEEFDAPVVDDALGDTVADDFDDVTSDLSNDSVAVISSTDIDPVAAADMSVGFTQPTNSEAYNLILDHLNNIQSSLGDVKLSEYRTLVAKLEDLTSQVRLMGHDYLGEQRKLKK